MSFGATADTKRAQNNLGGIANVAAENNANDVARGNSLMDLGGTNVSQGTNFFNTVLSGDRSNTAALLQPSIDQIREGNTNTLNSINTLMPRGGGRSASLFGQSFEPQRQIQNLFNNARTTAATTLPQIGLQQQGLGTNLFNIANGALNAGTGASSSLGNISQQQQQMANAAWSGVGNGLFKLATTPFGGGAAANGLLGLFGGGK